MGAQCRYLGQLLEVTIDVKYHRVIADGTCGDQTIGAGAYGQAGSSGGQKESHRFVKDRPCERLFERRNVIERRSRDALHGDIVKALQHFLNDRQARDNLAIRSNGGERFAMSAAENLDPRARVHQNHLRSAWIRPESG